MQQNKFGVVVQLVRIPACHAGGRGFESRPYRQSSLILNELGFFVVVSVVVLSFLTAFLVVVCVLDTTQKRHEYTRHR